VLELSDSSTTAPPTMIAATVRSDRCACSDDADAVQCATSDWAAAGWPARRAAGVAPALPARSKAARR